jgi:hypothetical protein
VFRSRADAALAAKIYMSVPVLVEQAKGVAGNPWGISLLRMFHMSDDSGLFRTAGQLREAGFIRDGVDWRLPTGAARPQAALNLTGGGDTRSLALEGGTLQYRIERYVPLYEAR